MEKTGITITKRKDGRYVGKFIAEYADNGKAQYHYVYSLYHTSSNNDFERFRPMFMARPTKKPRARCL